MMLKNPSVHAPNRKRRLQILSDKKVSKSRVTQLERDKRFVITAMKKKMKFSQRTGKPVDRPGEQLIELPLALCDSTGNPIGGNWVVPQSAGNVFPWANINKISLSV